MHAATDVTEQPSTFRTTVHGTVFADRASHLDELDAGDDLRLMLDPPGRPGSAVWVHLPDGDPLGHLPPEVSDWLAPWMLERGNASATTLRVGSHRVPSWKRLLIEVRCGQEAMAGP